MYTILDVFRNFFVHKDFLPPPDVWPGTLFSPLQIAFCALVAVFVAWASVRCAKKSRTAQNKIFLTLWAVMAVTEVGIGVYDVCAGAAITFEWGSILPLWHCSIFLYALPFAVLGKGNVRWAACGYVCTLGLLGGAVNFVYPATYLSRYSCISLAGFRTIFYHAAMIFTAVTMLLSGYHSFRVTRLQELLLPAVPALIVSIPANIVNFTVPGTDYMFFKLNSFFFAPIGAVLPDAVSVIAVYLLLMLVHAAPYLPSYVKNCKNCRK